MKPKTVYIAGPMRGIPLYNFPAFDAAKAELEALGWRVESPADFDREAGYDPVLMPADGPWNVLPASLSLRDVAARDLGAVADCDAVCLLPGWQHSQGARTEADLASWLGKEVFCLGDTEAYGRAFGTMEIVGADEAPDRFVSHPYSYAAEVRVTDPDTGGQKGVKQERFDLIPVEPLEDLARVYGYGATKYDDHNWRKGYSWSLSFGAMMRHAWAFWRGEDLDPESRLPHMAHVAWHCMTLLWFSTYRQEKDDRQKVAA